MMLGKAARPMCFTTEPGHDLHALCKSAGLKCDSCIPPASLGVTRPVMYINSMLKVRGSTNK